MTQLTAFKAYDIRGKLGEEITEELAYKVGRAYAEIYQPKTIAVGADIRLSSETLKQALIKGLTDAGVDVLDLGLTGTEEIYFAAANLDVGGGIEITASHNPIDYNGMKLVHENARPIGMASGLQAIHDLVVADQFTESTHKGTVKQYDILPEYVAHLLTYIDLKAIRPLKLVVNAGNGAAGHVIDALEAQFKALNIPLELIKIHHEPDGTFPNGIPNPLLVENRAVTREAVLTHQADIGIAWDGDFDRCFLFDEKGQFIEGYYIIGLLAQAFLSQSPNEKVVYEPRLVWNTIDIVENMGGTPIQSKSGHAYIKEVMRQENAIYGGEMSAHHYFRDFAYCDSGMIPWLLIVELLSKTGQPLSELVEAMIAQFPCSGEINFTVKDSKATIEKILQHYQPQNPKLDMTDGISLDFGDWRVNVRSSNTEPLLRLNIETDQRKNPKPMAEYIAEVSNLITSA